MAMVAMAQQSRQLVVVVEGTAALGFQWPILYKDYVEKIVRAFYGHDVNGQKLAVSQGETGLILFNSHHANQAGLVQQVGWTTNLDLFLNWLSNIQFTGGGFGDVAMAEGLAEALLMCVSGSNVTNVSQGSERQKHVLLVATSSPCIIPKPVATPPVSLSTDGNPTDQDAKQWCLADSEDVAKWFPQCFVSLSVICPRRLPQLRSIYNLAKRNVRSVEPEVSTQQYPYHTILLSDGFWEARAVLGNNGTSQTLVTGLKVESHDVPAVSGQGTSGLSAGHPAISTGALAKPKMEMSGGLGSLASMLSGTATATIPVQHSSNPDGLQSVADSGLQQGIVKQELSHSDISSAVSNPNLSSNLTQGYHGVTLPRGGNSNGLQVAHGSFQGVSNILSSQSSAVNTFPGVTLSQAGMAMGQGALGLGGLDMGMQGNIGSASFGLPNMTANMVSRAQTTSVSHPTQPSSQLPGLGPMRVLAGCTQIGQVNPRSISGLSGTVLPGRGTSQAGVSNGNRLVPLIGSTLQQQQPLQHTAQQNLQQPTMVQALQEPLQQSFQQPLQQTRQQQVQQTLQQPAALWEGWLAGVRRGKFVLICNLQCFRLSTSPETLAADWPPTMQITRLIDQELMNSKEFQGKAERLAFRPLTQHPFLVQLAERKLSAVIQLPSQTLLLSSSVEKKMVGMLFPGDMMVSKPPNLTQQQGEAASNFDH